MVASTAVRAYRNRHLGTLIHCCEAWEPVWQCFDQNSFECIDFHELSQIIASLARERLSEEKLKSTIFIGHRRKRTTPLQSADLVFALGAQRNRCFVSTQLPMKMVTLWKMKMNQAGDYVNIGARFSKHALKARGTIALKLS